MFKVKEKQKDANQTQQEFMVYDIRSNSIDRIRYNEEHETINFLIFRDGEWTYEPADRFEPV